MSTKSQIALLYEIELKTIVESATLSNSEKVKQLINFKPEPVWNKENKKYEYVRECGPIREKVNMYKPKYLEKLRDNDSRKSSLTEDEKSMIEHKIKVEKMMKLDCPNSKNGFIILGHDGYDSEEQVCGYTKNFAEAHTIALEAVTTGQHRIKEHDYDNEQCAFYSSRIVDLDTRLPIGTKMIGYYLGEDITKHLNWVIEEIKKLEEELAILEEEILKAVFDELAKI
jgi:hypothetical protein